MARLVRTWSVVAMVLGAFVTLQGQQSQQPAADQSGNFRFKSGVELINVTATVSDSSGRFVSGLRMEDFKVYEDDEPQTLTHFSAERVPVSLGIVLDTSGSMNGEKMTAARSALDRFLYDLLDKNDEIFIYRFSDSPMMVQGWTSDRQLLARALGRISPSGGTALYDAVAEAVAYAETGQQRKKAIVIISDGNDTSSQTTPSALQRLIRESEVLVYAIGIDGEEEPSDSRQPPVVMPPPRQPPRIPIPMPFPPRRPGIRPIFELADPQGGYRRRSSSSDRVNVTALRDITDDSGGRTEIIREARDLQPATAYIADELSRQYYLGYQASGKKDGRWHAIRVEVRNGMYRVRARRGYVAS